MVVRLRENAREANGGYTSASRTDRHRLASDGVGAAVLDYGRLPTKIASLAQLKCVPGARAEVAMLSLGRGYVNRCLARKGRWTSGLHVLWWTRERLAERPNIEVNDLRLKGALPLERQAALAEWTVIMMRLIFISDVGFYARSRDARVERLASFAELAAEKTGDLNPKRLLSWLKRDGMKLVNRALSEDRYETLSDEVRKQKTSE